MKKIDYFHNYFLNLSIKRSDALIIRKKNYFKSREKRIKKIMDMLKLFGIPEEDIKYTIKNFYVFGEAETL